jgi:hypothetical protein
LPAPVSGTYARMAGAFGGGDVLDSTVGGVILDLPGIDVPAKAGALEQVKRGLVLGHLKGCHEGVQNDLRFAAVHYVVGVVAEV